ncbi:MULTISPECIES: hypothetical protein [Streptomyces]|uniref:hypothetical protein n=1 Tax=Streptomyces roseolus TaxID=67358 RepID=UPI00378D8302
MDDMKLMQVNPGQVRTGDIVLGWLDGPYFEGEPKAIGPGLLVEAGGFYSIPIGNELSFTMPTDAVVIVGRVVGERYVMTLGE